jgi:hypothetical protein
VGVAIDNIIIPSTKTELSSLKIQLELVKEHLGID